MVDFGSTSVPLERPATKSDLPLIEPALPLPMPVTLRAASATVSDALETVSLIDSAAALIFEVDSSPGTEADGAVSVRIPSPD